MMSRSVLCFALLILPGIAEAQRGGGGGGSGAPPVNTGVKVDRGDRANYRGLGEGPGSITIADKDVKSMSPTKVFLQEKKSLALTDDQVKQFKAMDATLDSQNDSLFKQLDSLRKEMKVNKNAANPQVEQLRVRGARMALVDVIKVIRESYEKAEPGALAVLAEAQQKTGGELLEKHQHEAEQMLQVKLGGRSRGS